MAERKEWEIYDPVYGRIGRTHAPYLTRTWDGWLLQWERGTRRYTLGWRRWFRFHAHSYPMTPIEVRRRELPDA